MEREQLINTLLAVTIPLLSGVVSYIVIVLKSRGQREEIENSAILLIQEKFKEREAENSKLIQQNVITQQSIFDLKLSYSEERVSLRETIKRLEGLVSEQAERIERLTTIITELRAEVVDLKAKLIESRK